MPVDFEDVARLAAPNDNVAIAIHKIEAGTEIAYDDSVFRVSHTVLVGHRFAVQDITEATPLLSWGQRFGIATQAIKTGDYVINADVLTELRRRSLDFELPNSANFEDALEHYTFDDDTFTPAPPLQRYHDIRTFMGYARDGERGVGTRNTIVLLGTTSLVSGFVRKLESNLQGDLANYPNVDAIVAVTHTEGGHGKSNNEDFLLRTLAGFIVHPNVAAVLIVDYAHEAINNHLLRDYLQQNQYPLHAVHHHFMSLSESFERDLAQAENTVNTWLPTVNDLQRMPQPLSELKIALQCGGSDAFSGISGNPLASWVAKEIIHYGGCANLAETDELIGAESYVLDKVRDSDTAKQFLSYIALFKERMAWHGQSPDANPSGGNKYRGLYNIYLKSLGAATKRHPDVRLDHVIDYGERMYDYGFHFMNSPGNDLESIAGQVASGCNMIFFVTGNGSITNFPFVPTIKIVTTTERYNLLASDMDINAGAYLDGTPLSDVGADTLDYTVNIASGQHSVGEQAGHSQVQIWRDWHFTEAVDLDVIQNQVFSGQPYSINSDIDVTEFSVELLQDQSVSTSQRLGLIMPTSLCSGQIAKLCVNKLNQHPMLKRSAISRFVTLTHTEGCGTTSNPEFSETLSGYLAHPFVKHALLLEHGCEKTHNDYFRSVMKDKNLDPDVFGWASIQQDGGIQIVMQKMINWFEQQIEQESELVRVQAGLESIRIALVTDESVVNPSIFSDLTRMIVKANGLVVIGEHDALLNTDYLQHLEITNTVIPTISYAEQIKEHGFHVMAMPTHDRSEILAGLGTQVDLILSISDRPLAGHPMIPVLQLSHQKHSQTDVILNGNSQKMLLTRIADTLSRRYTPHATKVGNVNFQMTRGLLGVST